MLLLELSFFYGLIPSFVVFVWFESIVLDIDVEHHPFSFKINSRQGDWRLSWCKKEVSLSRIPIFQRLVSYYNAFRSFRYDALFRDQGIDSQKSSWWTYKHINFDWRKTKETTEKSNSCPTSQSILLLSLSSSLSIPSRSLSNDHPISILCSWFTSTSSLCNVSVDRTWMLGVEVEKWGKEGMVRIKLWR